MENLVENVVLAMKGWKLFLFLGEKDPVEYLGV